MGNSQSSAAAPPAQGTGCSYLDGQASGPAASSCPVPEQYRHQAVYNVYGQRINDPNAPAVPNPLAALKESDILDPRNNMPLEANQQPCPGQRKPLPTERMQSNIPKGGTDSTWLYPSPQMFFNGALLCVLACRELRGLEPFGSHLSPWCIPGVAGAQMSLRCRPVSSNEVTACRPQPPSLSTFSERSPCLCEYDLLLEF